MIRIQTFCNRAAACLLAAGLLASCQMEDDLKGKKTENTGYLQATVAPYATEPMLTRAASATYDVNDFPVAIVSNEDGDTIRRFDSYRDLQAEGQIALTAGSYHVVAWYGTDEANVQFTPYFVGKEDFTIIANHQSPVEAVCKLGRIKVSVNVGADFEEAFEDDYSITLNSGMGVETLNASNKDEALYFKVYSGTKTITATVMATPRGTSKTVTKTFSLYKQGEESTSGTTLDLEAGDAFKINLSASDTSNGEIVNPTETSFGLTVDLKWNDREETVEIPVEVMDTTTGGDSDDNHQEVEDPNAAPALTPSINGAHVWTLSLDYLQTATMIVDIQAPATIQQLNVTITSSCEPFAGQVANMGLTEFDLCNVTDSKTRNQLENTLHLKYNDDVKGQTAYTFDVSSFTGSLSNFPGVHCFNLSVTDGLGQTTEGTLVVTCAGAPDEEEEF